MLYLKELHLQPCPEPGWRRQGGTCSPAVKLSGTPSPWRLRLHQKDLSPLKHLCILL